MDYHPERWGMCKTDHLLDLNSNNGMKRTMNPTVTGTSIVAIKYKNGVMMASDCLGMDRDIF